MRALLRTFALVLAGVSAITFAGWRPAVSITGTPSDLAVADAGLFAVSAGGAGPTNSVFQCDGGGNCGTYATLPNPTVGAWIPSGGCFSVVQGQTIRQICPPAGTQALGGVGSAVRVRTTGGIPSGRTYIGMFNAGAAPIAIWTSPTGGTVNDWLQISQAGVGVPAQAAMGAVRVGPDDFGVIAATTNAYAFKNASMLSPIDTAGTPSDIWLYDQSGKPAAVFIVGGNLLYVPDLTNPDAGRTSAPVPAAAGPTNTIAFDWNDGSDAGRGFGMLTGSSAMWGAMPAPGAAGLNWSPRTGPGWPINELKRVSCFGAQFCAAIRASSVAANVAWYFNDSAPVLVMVPSPTVNEGNNVGISATTFDSDGDPVYVSWALGPLNGAALTATPVGGDPSNSGLTIATTNAGTFCTPSVQVTATPTLSDGWAVHDTPGSPSVITVQRTRGPSAPTVPATFTLNSDGGAQALTATPPGAGCPPDSYQWSLSPAAMAAGIGLVTDAGTTALLLPPVGFCNTAAGPYAVNLVGTDTVGVSSQVSTNVQIVRTTPPEIPSVMPSTATVDSDGGGVPFTASANMSGCPPQSYQWSLPGPALGAGITLVSDGGSTAFVHPPPGFCGISGGPFILSVAAVDAVGASMNAGASFTLQRTTPPDRPNVLPASVTLGLPDASFLLTASPAATGCAPTNYGWSFNDPSDSGFTLAFNSGPIAQLVPPSAFCGVDGGSAMGTVSVTGIDGVGPSTTAATVSVVINPNASPGPPTVSRMNVGLTPGGPTELVNASFSATGCAAQGFTWNLGVGADAGITLNVDGGQLTLVPPAAYCSPVAGQFDVSVAATSATSVSNAIPVAVTLSPWGAPLNPLFDAGTYQQDAGTVRSYGLALPEHLCAAAPVSVAWEFDAGATGATLSSTSNLSATVSAPDCVNGIAQLSAQRFLSTDTTTRSSRVSVDIDIGTHLDPIGADAGLAVTSMASPGSGAEGTVSYSGFRCENLRNAQARIRLFPVGGGADVAVGVFDGGPWELAIAGGCNGGTFAGLAELLENGVPTGTEQPVPSFTLPSIQAAVGPLIEDRVTVTCEAGLNTVLELEQAPGACRATETIWAMTEGDEALVTQNPLRGTTVNVQSRLGLGLEELVGQDLVWDVSADAGSGNLARAQRGVHLVAEPFVTITHQAEHTRVSEGDVLGVQATLVNGTECTVSSLMLRESLASLSYLEGSARVDGRTVPASAEGGILTIGPVELGGRATAKVTWLGRVPLSPKVVFSAQAVLHGETVSVDATSQPISPRGCGCDSSGGAFSMFALLGALLLARRQRKPKTASS